MANSNKCTKALKEFQKQYPFVTSADLQTFILGFKAGEATVTVPKSAMIIKGCWKKEGYGGVWCKINQISEKTMSLNHPTYGGFAWVDIKDCIFKS